MTVPMKQSRSVLRESTTLTLMSAMATSEPMARERPDTEENTLKMKATKRNAAVTVSWHKSPPKYGAWLMGTQLPWVQKVNKPKDKRGVLGA